MAIYHIDFKLIKRSEGKSSVYLSAYQNRETYLDERTGAKWNYTKKPGFDGSVILSPPLTPQWLVKDSPTLWNAVESIEKRKDAQTCRYFDVAIPVELDDSQKRQLVIDYCQNHFVDSGMIADIAFHDLDSNNPHAHVMLTMREITPEGFGNKVREWNDRDQLHKWREEWANEANKAISNAGFKKGFISHKTLVEQKQDAEVNFKNAKSAERKAYYQAKIIELDRQPMRRIYRKDWEQGKQQRKQDQKIRDLHFQLAKKQYAKIRKQKTQPTPTPEPKLIDIIIKSRKAIANKIRDKFDKLKTRLKSKPKPKTPSAKDYVSPYYVDEFGEAHLKSDFKNYDSINNQKIRDQLKAKQEAETLERERLKALDNNGSSGTDDDHDGGGDDDHDGGGDIGMSTKRTKPK